MEDICPTTWGLLSYSQGVFVRINTKTTHRRSMQFNGLFSHAPRTEVDSCRKPLELLLVEIPSTIVVVIIVTLSSKNKIAPTKGGKATKGGK